MNMIVNYKQYIEQIFSGCPGFGKRVNCCINHLGHATDQVILKIVLPNLPNNIKYKNNPVYDLVNSIHLEIGGITYLKYTGEQLKKLDIMSKNFERKSKIANCDQNCILYPINLSDFFGESIIETDTSTNNQPFDLAFKGIRLCDLSFHEVRFFIEFNDIFSIIEDFTDFELELHYF